MGALSCGVLRYTSAFSIAVTSGLEGWHRVCAIVLMLSGICCFGSAQTSPVVGKGIPVSAIHKLDALQSNQSSEPSSSFRISVSSLTDTFLVGSPSIPVIIKVANTSNSPIYLTTFLSGGELLHISLQFDLTLDGNAVPKTGLHKDYGHVDGSAGRIRIDPGSAKRLPIDLKKLFDIAKPGSYTLSVTRPANRSSNSEVRSEPLRLMITN